MAEDFRLPRSAPESQGIDSRTILNFLLALDPIEYMHSFMLLRHGRVVAEGNWRPYRKELAHHLFSLSKSFTSAAVGLAMAEGRFKLDDRVVALFPEKAPADISERLSHMTVRHLLTMATGHKECLLGKCAARQNEDWVKVFLSEELAYEPGTHFVYNSAASFMLAALVEKFTGERLVDYLMPRLFEPLGIPRPRWDCNPDGIALGGWGLWLDTESLAKFGQMILQKGVWQGRQILPADYLAMATSFQMDNSANESPDWKLGYGFQFWMSQRHCFRGDGACGQYILVMPEQDAVLVTTSGVSNMQRILDAVWAQLLPGMGGQALPAQHAVELSLLMKIESLALPFPRETTDFRPAMSRYRIADDKGTGIRSLIFVFTEEECLLTIQGPHGDETLHAGFGGHRESELRLNDAASHPMASAAAWEDDRKTLLIQSFYLDAPYRLQLYCTFEEGRVTVKPALNLEFLAPKWAELTGEAF